jgi:phosphatidylethanolamine/phosphatidyl-N-methylethanolamine N-methyltransferase
LSLKDYLQFIVAFVARPDVVGAIAPSSTSLCRMMVDWIEWDHVLTILEYGPGTGVCTAHIVSRIQPGARFLAIEINAAFVSMLRHRFPQVQIHQESVLTVKKLCDVEGISEVDAIISGLPWACFSAAEQGRYLDATLTVLRPGGQFVTFAYLSGLLLAAGQHFRRQLYQRFSAVHRSRVVWRNVPPAFVYRCYR